MTLTSLPVTILQRYNKQLQLEYISFVTLDQQRKHHCVEPSTVKKLLVQLDKMTYIAINKNKDHIVLHICQPQTVIKLNREQILTFLSLKPVIEQTICYMSHMRQKESVI